MIFRTVEIKADGIACQIPVGLYLTGNKSYPHD